MRQNFVTCIALQLQDKRFGKERQEKIIERFNALADGYKAEGNVDPELTAMNVIFHELSIQQAEKDKRALYDLVKTLERRDRFENFMKNTAVAGATNEASNPARVANAIIEHDPRAGGLDVSTLAEVRTKQLWAIMDGVAETIGKGAFGVQRGKAHLPNVVREVFGKDTGDAAAKTVAQSFKKTSDAVVDLMNSVGGSLNKLDGWNFPQKQNVAKMIGDKAGWIKFHLDALDWAKMRNAIGGPIQPGERESILNAVFDTLTTNGVNKIDPSAFRGRGAAIGNSLDQHRFLVYKGPEEYLAMHEKYGDGNIFDVMASYIDTMGHRIALVQLLGSNPSAGLQHMRAMARVEAQKLGPQALEKANEILKNKFDPMSDYILRRNPMAANSLPGNIITSVSNLLVAAQLGGASLLAIPGDAATAYAVRAFNGMGKNPFPAVGEYLKAFVAAESTGTADIARQSGVIMDQYVSSVYATQRFGFVQSWGSHITQNVSDAVMRASLLAGHTNAGRWAVQSEMLGLYARYASTQFEDLPFKAMLERYGINANDWDAFRVIEPNTKMGTPFLRPIDLLETKIKGKDDLFSKFQSVVLRESMNMIPEGTIEGAVTLRGTSRPDTLAGAVLHSFSMYKNFPVSMMNIYGRLAMSSPSRAGRLGFMAGLGASMTLMGALGLQMRELAKGREPLPMDNMGFVGKSFLAGGALSIWGDFLFSGVNRFGGGPVETLAGPFGQLTGDVANLVFGGGFAWASLGDKEVNTAARAVQFAKRYTPGTSLWYARLGLERYVWDALEELADPKVYQRRRRMMQQQQKEQGNSYWWAPGER